MAQEEPHRLEHIYRALEVRVVNLLVNLLVEEGHLAVTGERPGKADYSPYRRERVKYWWEEWEVVIGLVLVVKVDQVSAVKTVLGMGLVEVEAAVETAAMALPASF